MPGFLRASHKMGRPRHTSARPGKRGTDHDSVIPAQPVMGLRPTEGDENGMCVGVLHKYLFLLELCQFRPLLAGLFSEEEGIRTAGDRDRAQYAAPARGGGRLDPRKKKPRNSKFEFRIFLQRGDRLPSGRRSTNFRPYAHFVRGSWVRTFLLIRSWVNLRARSVILSVAKVWRACENSLLRGPDSFEFAPSLP